MADEERADVPPIRGYGVRFFPYAPDLNDRVREWAEKQGVRVLSVVPVYFEDPYAGEDERTE